MIVNLKYYKEHGYIKGVIFIVRKMFLSLNQPVIKEQVSKWGGETLYENYPKFKLNEGTGSFNCTSCKLCSDICPTNCISVEGTVDVNDIRVGNSPKSFLLDLSSCTQCNKCIDVCPVDALSNQGRYAQSYFDSKSPLDLKQFEKERLKSI